MSEADDIGYYEAGVGSGKTKIIIENMRKHEGKPHLYVVPTKALAEDIARRLIGSEHSKPTSGFMNSVKVVHSDTILAGERVAQVVLSRLLSAEGKRGVTLVTTKSFHDLFIMLENTQILKGFHIILDEGLKSAFTSQAFLDKSSCKLAKDLFYTTGNGNRKANLDKLSLITAILEGDMKRIPDGYYALKDNEALCEMLTFAKSKFFDVRMNWHEGRVDMAAGLRAEVFDDAGAVTIVLANFKNTALCKSLQATNDGRYEFVSLDTAAKDELFDTHKEKGSLVNIGYLLHLDDPATMTNLKKTVDGEPVWKHALAACDKFFSGLQDGFVWIYTINETFSHKARRASKGERIPTQNSGLDIHKQKNGVAVLATQNQPIALQTLLSEVLNCDVADLYMDDSFNHAYQTVGRCSIRNRAKQDKIYMLVLSKGIADRLLDTFEGSVDLGQLSNLPSLKAESNAERNRSIKKAAQDKNAGRVWEGKHRTAWNRYKAKCKQDDIQPMDRNAFYDWKYA